MGKIQVLPDILASQVAAGEVVERPASVVKELVENSLDAGATQIAVLARRGGTALLRIVDNGSGMSRADALMSLERHATSKLRTSADLAAILTKGFRGEALPSIASVAKFTLATREHDAISGTRIILEGGNVLEISDDGDAPGTTIEVRQLFYNVPARRKFLRSEDTEFSHIEQQVRVQALAHPETGFSLTRDDRLLFHLPPGDSLLGRIAGLTGADLTDRLLEIPRTTRGPITVSGFIGEAGLWRSNRALQFTFLNRRPVESIAFSQALRAGYGDALPRGQAPVTFLMIEIDPAEVDVNVHPAKREVRFRNSSAVQSALTEIIAATVRAGRPLMENPAAPGSVSMIPVPRWSPGESQPSLLPQAHAPHPAPAPRHVWEGVPIRPGPPAAGSAFNAPTANAPTANAPTADAPTAPGSTDTPAITLSNNDEPVAEAPPESAPAAHGERSGSEGRAGFPGPAGFAPSVRFAPAAPAAPAAPPAPPSASDPYAASGLSASSAPPAPVSATQGTPPPGFHPIGLLGSAYLILESAEGLVLLDHRAAWERILYEEARARAAAETPASQALLTPLTLSLSPREFDFIKPHLGT
ncbi:MAG: mismatch repair protein MutL, partial [Verrucomicrobiales bacterium]|nr:mismatch repair protein MutL [Verrucomicrobiales bacterium]